MRHFETHINNTLTYITMKTLFIKKTYKLSVLGKEKKTRDVRQSCTRSSITTNFFYDNIARMSMQVVKKIRISDPTYISLLLYSCVAEAHRWVLQIIWRRLQ